MSKDFEPEVYQRTGRQSYSIRDKNNRGYLSEDGKWSLNALQCWPTEEAAQKVVDDYLKKKERRKRAGEIFETPYLGVPYFAAPPTLPQRLQEICRALEGITPEEQERVLKAAILLLGLPLSPPKPKEEPEAAKPGESPSDVSSWLYDLKMEILSAIARGESSSSISSRFDAYLKKHG